MTRKRQPVDEVLWVHRSELRANDYNPNRVAPPELRLLRLSISEDGWTQPIVVHPHEDGGYEIVDGFHRWTVSDDEVLAPGGLVPVVVIHPSQAQQRMSTVRHNRARGTHHVVKMADIVADLADQGVPRDEIGRRMGMDPEEVDRLVSRGSINRRAGAEMSEAWKPAVKG